MSETLDCLVVGGGPAGLTAAIYLGRFRRRFAVVDQGWSRALWIPRSHNIPGFARGVPGPALLEEMRAQARLYGASLRTGLVERLRRTEDGRFAAAVDGVEVVARTVLLATGVIENKPPLAHFADAVKRGLVRTCPVCDGYEAIGKRVGVFGAGDHAAKEALFLRTYADRVTLLLPADEGGRLSDGLRQSLAAAAIATAHVTGGAVSVETDGVMAVDVEDGLPHRFDLIYSAFGATSQSQLAKALGARADVEGRLYVDDHRETSVGGLYAAGDVVRGLNQICVATADAAIAATSVHNRLEQVFA
jgi:thioredoxin reductase (NADPH)